jgi:metal-dependent amidase/aminoacylase/carboxypeptidase family protein
LPGTAITTFDVHYTGKEAHVAASPELGINALTIAQTAIGLLRQHMRAPDRVHGIIIHGGDTANVIPAHTKARYMVRAKTIRDLDDIITKAADEVFIRRWCISYDAIGYSPVFNSLTRLSRCCR